MNWLRKGVNVMNNDLHEYMIESLKELERLFIENEIEDTEDDTEW